MRPSVTEDVEEGEDGSEGESGEEEELRSWEIAGWTAVPGER